MKAISLLKIQNEAKELQVNQKITYNQALHKVAKKNGFKAYQALLEKIKKDYIDDEDNQIKEFKSNVFENRKHIESNFIKIEKLSKKYGEIRFNEKYDDDEETREELIEEIEEKAAELSNSIAKMFFGNVLNKLTDNQKLCVEGGAYAGYISSNYQTFHNDIDANNADYFIELDIENQRIEFSYRDFNIDKYEDIDNEGNKFIGEIKEWNDWCQTSEIELPF
ncbi:hypothetical protein [Halarcobacter ebronensis]|uniref:Uncharacterized protein n=1 Tax=Halarcobacter ebronensis TaxID=1462615 RepID=A0A4Q1AN86_9BACT|nr:hypothetical protein [Halarcobacter ebronensis]QKF82403.1 hypothetical protein AEBR_1923 [Halarcobacter ebronensis]RXK07574.1 hypothetical protein CRV07_03685 [Halarcobacter ebronensis]